MSLVLSFHNKIRFPTGSVYYVYRFNMIADYRDASKENFNTNYRLDQNNCLKIYGKNYWFIKVIVDGVNITHRCLDVSSYCDNDTIISGELDIPECHHDKFKDMMFKLKGITELRK